MNKVIVSFILLAIAIGVKANTLVNDTLCYHYYASDSSVDGQRVPDMFDEILVLVRNGSTAKCLYYGPSIEFDNSPEPFLPGFITLEATDLSMNDGRICFRLNPTGRKYFSQPVELQLHTENEILAIAYGYKLQNSFGRMLCAKERITMNRFPFLIRPYVQKKRRFSIKNLLAWQGLCIKEI